jgi:hypothetical protein
MRAGNGCDAFCVMLNRATVQQQEGDGGDGLALEFTL